MKYFFKIIVVFMICCQLFIAHTNLYAAGNNISNNQNSNITTTNNSNNSNNSNNQSDSLLNDMISFTSSLSNFFGSAISFMTQTIGYLTGGIQAAHLFQTGTNIINNMLVNGPTTPQIPLPQVIMPSNKPETDKPSSNKPTTNKPNQQLAPSINDDETSSPAPTINQTANENAIAGVTQSKYVSDDEFVNLLKGYKSLALEETRLLKEIKDNPKNVETQELYKHVQQAKIEQSSKIIAALNYDIEKKQYTKLHLLIEYINTNGNQTLKIFAEIIDSTKSKLQFSLVEAQKYGLNVDIEIIEGKLQLVMSLATGSFAPTTTQPSNNANTNNPKPTTQPKKSHKAKKQNQSQLD